MSPILRAVRPDMFAALLALLLTTAGLASHAQDIPTPSAGKRVVDQTGSLSPAQTEDLATKLKALETERKVQAAVLLVATTGAESIEQYAHRVFTTWGIGQKGVDNGLLMVFAVQDRKARLEVGRGLEGNLPDVLAKRIIADVVTAHLKATRGQDFHGAISRGILAIDTRMRQDPVATSVTAQTSTDPGVLVILWFGLFVVIAGCVILVMGWRKDAQEERERKARREQELEKFWSENAANRETSRFQVAKKPSARSMAAKARHKRLARETSAYADMLPAAYTDYLSSSSGSSSSDSSGFGSFGSSDNGINFGGGDSGGGGASSSW